MCERINAINQYYKILAYDKINKQEALNKISTLHKNLKFKNNNFSDRYFQIASVIEKNLSLFKSVCNHVDIITTLLDHLYANGIKIMFDKNTLTTNDLNIIYIMFIICEESEIPSFLKKTIVDNSNLIDMYKLYEPRLTTNYIIEMIVFEDSDLYAIITYLKIKPCSLLQMKKIFIQESVKQKFLWLLQKNFKNLSCMELPIFIFHSRNELFTNCKDFVSHFNMMSIWTEDNTFAKTLAMKLQMDLIFINAYLEFGTTIKFPFEKIMFRCFRTFLYHGNEFEGPEDGGKINLNTYTGSVYNHFYNGTWQKPVSDIYWIHNDNIYAHATRVDLNRAIDSAIEAFKSWSNLPTNSRVEILNNLAYTLEHNGKYLLAETVLKCIKQLNKECDNLLTCQDERLELISMQVAAGVTSFYHTDEVAVFNYLTISLYFGNCVLIIHTKHSCNIMPYFNMFSTAEIPPGVINLISHENIPSCPQTSIPRLPYQLLEITIPKNIILPLK